MFHTDGPRTRVLELSTVGERIVTNVRQLLHVRTSALYVPDSVSGDLVMVAKSCGPGSDFQWQDRLRSGDGAAGLAVRLRETVVSTDVLTDPRIVYDPDTRAGIEASGWRGLLAVPLLAQDGIIGVLTMSDRPGRVFMPEQITLAGMFADQAAAALENARLYRLSEARQRRLATMVAVARKLTSRLDLASVLATVSEAAAEVFEAEVGFRLIQGDELVRFGATAGAATVMVRERLTLGESISGRVAQTGEPIITDDTSADARVIAEHRAAQHPISTTALLCVPIRGSSRVLGTLNIYRELGRRFDDEDVSLAMNLASQAGVALENARLYEEASRQRREAETLARMSRTLTESLDIAAVGQQIVESVHELLGTRTSALRRLERDGSLHVIAASGGMRTSLPLSHVLPPSVGVEAVVIATGRSVWSADALTDPRLTLSAELRRELQRSGVSSLLAVPLQVKDRIIGVLNVGDVAGRVFSEAESELLQTFADQAALAVENARLYREALDAYRQLSERIQAEQAARARAEASEEALRQSERRYRLLFDRNLAGVLWSRQDGLIVDCNESLARLLGYDSRDALLSMNTMALYADPSARADVLASLEPGGVNNRRELHWRRRDGTPIWFRTNVRVADDGLMEAILIDISDEKRLAHLEREASELLAIAKVAAATAHEINNPLTVLIGQVALMDRENPGNRRSAKILGASERIRDIVTRMTRITRVEMFEHTSSDLPQMIDIKKSSDLPSPSSIDGRA